MEVIKNQKGGQKVCFDGYMYNKHISKETYIRWRCTKHNSGCKGTLRTTSNIESPVVISEHNHQGDQRNVDVAKVRVDMKERASRPEGKPCQIIVRSTDNVPLDSLGLLPDNKTLKRTIQNEKARNFPVEPPLVNDLNLEEHEKFKKTKPDENGHAEDFLLYDNENRQGNRIICFASKTQLKQLAEARIWYLDGNHKMSPRNFEQVYFIRTNLGENCSVLAISSFLQRKTEETYSELFRMLVDKCEQTFGYVPSPEIAMIDFEAAAKNALEGALDAQTEVKGTSVKHYI